MKVPHVGNIVPEVIEGTYTVVERGHTAILGWSPRIFTIVSEITVANENHPGLAIVVLADRAQDELEDELRKGIAGLRFAESAGQFEAIGEIFKAGKAVSGALARGGLARATLTTPTW